MRLLCVEHKTVWGGGQVALVNLLCEWQRTGASVEALVVCPPGAELASRLLALPVQCETFDLGAIEKRRGIVWNLSQRLVPTARLLSLIRRTRTDVVLANGAFSFLAAVFAAKLARVPIVWLEHNTTLPDDGMMTQMLGRADHIVVVSAAIREQFLQLAPHEREKISVIYNGVDTTKFSPDPVARSRIRQKLGWDEQVRGVGTVSRLSPEKGIATLVDAAHVVRRSFPQAQFLVVGDGPLRLELEQRAAGAGIRFVGAQENVAGWLNALDLFVMPSLAEAFGIAVVEAMACGLPVIASDVGGLREIVVENETGLRVPPQNVNELARAIETLLADANTGRALGEVGRRRVEQLFTLDRQARSMERVLGEQRIRT